MLKLKLKSFILVNSSGSVSQPYQFGGYYLEEEVGLYLEGRRWYEQEVGRYISRNSPYLFRHNNPVSNPVYSLPVYTLPISDITTSDNPKEPHFESPKKCAERIADEVKTYGPQVEGDKNSLTLHCVASCRIVRECFGGLLTAFIAGLLHELSFWREDSWCDLRANAIGMSKAYSNKSCEEACLDAWEKGDLPRCCNKK